MALYLAEEEVVELFPMERALECVEASFQAQHSGGATNRSRERIFLPGMTLHYMAAGLVEEMLAGMKVYTVTRGEFRFVVLIFSGESGELVALLEADNLGRIRTGAASGVATKYLANQEASRAGVIGAGRQARTQLEAISKVRRIRAAKVFSRDENRRREFCRDMTARLGFEVEPAGSAEEAARFGDVVTTATTSSDPVLRAEWLAPGAHVNAIGANMYNRREVDEAVLARASVITVDSIDQSMKESGDLIQGLPGAQKTWADVVELHEIISATRPGRTSKECVTLFKSNGIAIWDVAAAAYVIRQAKAAGRGREIEWGKGGKLGRS